MSIFSETKLALPNNGLPYNTAISHTSEMPIVAVMSQNCVLFYDENGDILDFKLERYKNFPKTRQFDPSVLDWHPKMPILAIGWTSGAVTLVNMKSKRPKEESNYHQSPILKLQYNENGDRMCTVDQDGNIAIWKDMNCLQVFEKHCEVTSMTSASMVIQRKNKAPKNLNLFFIGGKDGKFHFANPRDCVVRQ